MDSLKLHASEELACYLAQFPAQADRLNALRAQLDATAEDVFSRTNMRGHITSSALVIDPRAATVLLIHHKVYDLWLQPGGHYEGHVSLWESAKREVAEETGITNAVLHRWCQKVRAPLDIDTHSIAEQPKKQEGAHFHHDFCYLAEADSTLPLAPQENEVFGAMWVPLDNLWEFQFQGRRLHHLRSKLKQLCLVAG